MNTSFPDNNAKNDPGSEQPSSVEYEPRAAELTELKISAGQIAEQQNSIRQRSVSLQDQLEHTRGELETTNSDFAACDEQIAQSERDILVAQAAVSEH